MKTLPVKPHLEFLKKEAKQLRNAIRVQSQKDLTRARYFDQAYSLLSDAEFSHSQFSINDAQRIVAREYGFTSWAKLKRFIETLGAQFNQTLHDEIIALEKVDQEFRQKLINDAVLYEGYHPEMESIHISNARVLEKRILEYGWPGVALVGLDGCRAAWRIVQHAISLPKFQKSCLVLLQEAAERGDIPDRQVAYLADSISFQSGLAQQYGTIADWNEKGELVYHVSHDEKLAERRALVGLGPLEEELKYHRQRVNSEGGASPKNRDKFKAEYAQWAKRVGWR